LSLVRKFGLGWPVEQHAVPPCRDPAGRRLHEMCDHVMLGFRDPSAGAGAFQAMPLCKSDMKPAWQARSGSPSNSAVTGGGRVGVSCRTSSQTRNAIVDRHNGQTIGRRLGKEFGEGRASHLALHLADTVRQCHRRLMMPAVPAV
jgi:hypothetical protein